VDLALVVLVDVGHRLLEERANQLAVVGGRPQAVLGVGDLGLHCDRREPLGVDVQVAEAALHQPARIGLVVDGELARVAQPRGVGAQHPRAGGVEGEHPHRPHPRPQQQLDPVAHLLGGLVGERDGQDLPCPRPIGAHQPCDPVGEHARLAAPGPGQDQQRAALVDDGLALGRVETGEEGFEVLLGRCLGHPGNGSGRDGRPTGGRGGPGPPSHRAADEVDVSHQMGA
jgi:hypothetical protein